MQNSILNSFLPRLKLINLRDNKELRSSAWVIRKKRLMPRGRREWKDSSWSNRVVLLASLRPSASSMRRRTSKLQDSQDLAIQELMELLMLRLVKMTNVVLSSLL